jgi:hypothetical protein
MAKVMIFHCPFKILEKSLYEAVEVVITKFFIAKPCKAAELMCNTSIVLERDVRNQAGIADFEFWDKNAEKFSIPSPEGNNAVRIMTIHKSKVGISSGNHAFAEEDYSRKP